MTDLTQRFSIASENVATKIMDGEAIIINLASGVYYSMEHVGATIWNLIQTGHSLEECVDAVSKQFNVSRENVQTDTEKLIEELIEEELITTSSNPVASTASNEPVHSTETDYESPRLNIYRDMGDLLALDPPTPGLQISPWGNPEADENTS